jgi:hypothetical protein
MMMQRSTTAIWCAAYLVAVAYISGVSATCVAQEDFTEGAYLRPQPRPKPCLVPVGARFISVDELDAGIGPAGPVKGHWFIKFDKKTFNWTFSDMAVSGRHACDGPNVTGYALSGTYSGVFNADTGQLDWQGHRYAITGKHARKYRRLDNLPTPKPTEQPEPVKFQPVKPDPAKPAPHTPEPTRYETPWVIDQLGKSEQETRGCKSHEDCIITCHVDGDCCGTMCGCSNALNRDFNARLDAYLQKKCVGKRQSCPAVACRMRDPSYATCNNGLCESHSMGDGIGSTSK